jgi:ElaA protein
MSFIYNWNCIAFKDIANTQLYEILKVRNEVFVVEQNCVYNDVDGKDDKSFHVLVTNNNNELLAYTRLLPLGISYPQFTSIGRVLTTLNARKLGLGKQLMEYSIAQCYEKFGKEDIRIGAQLYLKKFYESFGFIQSSEVYLEDGIEHIEMDLKVY